MFVFQAAFVDMVSILKTFRQKLGRVSVHSLSTLRLSYRSSYDSWILTLPVNLPCENEQQYAN